MQRINLFFVHRVFQVTVALDCCENIDIVVYLDVNFTLTISDDVIVVLNKFVFNDKVMGCKIAKS